MSTKVAIIGAGNVARSHLSALQKSETVQVVGVYDADRSRAEARVNEYGLGRVYDSWSAILTDSEIDAVGVLLPHDLHCSYTIEALEAGRGIQQIAFDLGYSSPSAFISMFRRLAGTTPEQYRLASRAQDMPML